MPYETSSKRQEIIDRAYALFYDGGFHATGIDKVMADSGISKRTLYKYFPSKEHLIEAVLEHYGAAVETKMLEPAMARTADPRGRILALFDVRRELMDASDCLGCLAMKAAQEYRGRHAGIEAIGQRASVFIEHKMAELCAEAGLSDPAVRGRQVSMLLQGAVLTSQVRGDTAVFADARAAAERLLA